MMKNMRRKDTGTKARIFLSQKRYKIIQYRKLLGLYETDG
jgi:hypothetical protein